MSRVKRNPDWLRAYNNPSLANYTVYPTYSYEQFYRSNPRQRVKMAKPRRCAVCHDAMFPDDVYDSPRGPICLGCHNASLDDLETQMVARRNFFWGGAKAPADSRVEIQYEIWTDGEHGRQRLTRGKKRLRSEEIASWRKTELMKPGVQHVNVSVDHQRMAFKNTTKVMEMPDNAGPYLPGMYPYGMFGVPMTYTNPKLTKMALKPSKVAFTSADQAVLNAWRGRTYDFNAQAADRAIGPILSRHGWPFDAGLVSVSVSNDGNLFEYVDFLRKGRAQGLSPDQVKMYLEWANAELVRRAGVPESRVYISGRSIHLAPTAKAKQKLWMAAAPAKLAGKKVAAPSRVRKARKVRANSRRSFR